MEKKSKITDLNNTPETMSLPINDLPWFSLWISMQRFILDQLESFEQNEICSDSNNRLCGTCKIQSEYFFQNLHWFKYSSFFEICLTIKSVQNWLERAQNGALSNAIRGVESFLIPGGLAVLWGAKSAHPGSNRVNWSAKIPGGSGPSAPPPLATPLQYLLHSCSYLRRKYT